MSVKIHMFKYFALGTKGILCHMEIAIFVLGIEPRYTAQCDTQIFDKPENTASLNSLLRHYLFFAFPRCSQRICYVRLIRSINPKAKQLLDYFQLKQYRRTALRYSYIKHSHLASVNALC